MRLHVKLLARKKKHDEAREYVQGAVTALEDVVGTDETIEYILNELEEDQYKYLPEQFLIYILREKRDASSGDPDPSDDGQPVDVPCEQRETD